MTLAVDARGILLRAQSALFLCLISLQLTAEDNDLLSGGREASQATSFDTKSDTGRDSNAFCSLQADSILTA